MPANLIHTVMSSINRNCWAASKFSLTPFYLGAFLQTSFTMTGFDGNGRTDLGLKRKQAGILPSSNLSGNLYKREEQVNPATQRTIQLQQGQEQQQQPEGAFSRGPQYSYAQLQAPLFDQQQQQQQIQAPLLGLPLAPLLLAQVRPRQPASPQTLVSICAAPCDVQQLVTCNRLAQMHHC